MEFLETLIVGAIVFLAAAFLVRHLARKGKTSGCGGSCGCGGSQGGKTVRILEKVPAKDDS